MTEKEMSTMSDIAFAVMELQLRLGKVKHQETPLASKLRSAIQTLKALDIQETEKPVNWWRIIFTGQNGESIRPRDVSFSELDRIGELISRGYSQGQICKWDEMKE